MLARCMALWGSLRREGDSDGPDEDVGRLVVLTVTSLSAGLAVVFVPTLADGCRRSESCFRLGRPALFGLGLVRLALLANVSDVLRSCCSERARGRGGSRILRLTRTGKTTGP